MQTVVHIVFEKFVTKKGPDNRHRVPVNGANYLETGVRFCQDINRTSTLQPISIPVVYSISLKKNKNKIRKPP